MGLFKADMGNMSVQVSFWLLAVAEVQVMEYTYDIAWWLWKFIYLLVYENVYFCTMLSDYSYIFALWPVYLWSAKHTYFSDSSYYYEE